jgi:hypothetical protein
MQLVSSPGILSPPRPVRPYASSVSSKLKEFEIQNTKRRLSIIKAEDRRPIIIIIDDEDHVTEHPLKRTAPRLHNTSTPLTIHYSSSNHYGISTVKRDGDGGCE